MARRLAQAVNRLRPIDKARLRNFPYRFGSRLHPHFLQQLALRDNGAERHAQRHRIVRRYLRLLLSVLHLRESCMAETARAVCAADGGQRVSAPPPTQQQRSLRTTPVKRLRSGWRQGRGLREHGAATPAPGPSRSSVANFGGLEFYGPWKGVITGLRRTCFHMGLLTDRGSDFQLVA